MKHKIKWNSRTN